MTQSPLPLSLAAPPICSDPVAPNSASSIDRRAADIAKRNRRDGGLDNGTASVFSRTGMGLYSIGRLTILIRRHPSKRNI
jgi:hypothetical protein